MKITPGYVQPGGPPLWIASMAEAGALRAAKFGTNLLPQGERARSLDPWLAKLKEEGRDPADHRIGIIRSCLVTDDRERDWAAVRVAERRRMEIYNKFREEAGGHGGVAGISEGKRIPQTWVVGNVDHCVAELSAFIEEYGLTDIVTWAVPPGMRPDQINRQPRALTPAMSRRAEGEVRMTPMSSRPERSEWRDLLAAAPVDARSSATLGTTELRNSPVPAGWLHLPSWGW